jgi:methionyl-tRNA synthetase
VTSAQTTGTDAARRVLVTSALPYANGPIHFGHIAGAYLPADIYVRLLKARGLDVVYICGTDEHGVAITLTAQQAGVTPREHVDKWHVEIKKIFDRFDIRFDHFSRTSTPQHAEISQEFFRQLVKNGYVEPKDSEQLYCVKDRMFLPDRYVTGTCHGCGFEGARGDECPRCGAWIDPLKLIQPACNLCGATPQKRITRHWYLMLDRLQPRLEEFIGERSHWKRNVLQFVHGLLKEGLQPRPITRDLDWGVPVPLPDTEGKVIYVWFDAPIGYITATQEWAGKLGAPDRWKDYWQSPESRIVHFIGKDNIPFHCLTFPAMMMGQDEPWTLVADVPANEFFNLEGGKFNTSAGWYIDLEEFFSRYSTDMIRWVIARNLPENSDAEFTWGDFQAKVNGELADIYGNLAHRVLSFVHRYFDGVVPPVSKPAREDDDLEAARRQAPEQVAAALEAFRIREGAVEVMNLARAGNRYFDAVAPWRTRKEDRERCGTTLNHCVSLLETLAVIAAPFIPSAAARLWEMLGQEGTVADASWDDAGAPVDPAGRKLGETKPLFTKIPDEQVQAEIAALHERARRREAEQAPPGADEAADAGQSKSPKQAKPQEPRQSEAAKRAKGEATMTEAGESAGAGASSGAAGLPEMRPQVTIDDFLKCDLRLAKILDAEKVPGSKKLLKFTVDTGLDTRTVLAGIQEYYEPEDLVGKTVVVIANLAPRRMMGYDSQGMVLAAEIDGKLTVITPLTEGLRPGAQLS